MLPTSIGQQHKQALLFLWHTAAAVAIRLLLVLLGAGDALVWQPEVTTPANTLLATREGLGLLQLGVSPYAGDSCHAPPLWLAVTAPVALHPVLFVIPNIICDLVAAAALYTAAAALYDRSSSSSSSTPRDTPWLGASQLALLYLFNPATIMTCVAGTLTSAENAAVLVAVAGGCLRNGPLGGFGLAVGAYLGLHPLLLLVPLLLMLWQGPEDPLQSVPLSLEEQQQQHNNRSYSSDEQEAAEGEAVGSAQRTSQPVAGGRLLRSSRRTAQEHEHQQPDSQQQQQSASTHKQQDRRLTPCLLCIASLLACGLTLVALSDSVLQQHPSAQCLGPAVHGLLQSALHQGHDRTAVGPRSVTDAQQQQQLGSCWAARVYGLTLFLEDLTPNIGLWWYFFTEVFTEFQPFFLFVFHSFALILVAPVALRFPRRPLFVAWVQLFVCSMFRPYASVGHMATWMCLLPLLQQQLQSMKLRMFLVNSFVLLVVLGPAMWHQWIVLDSANANFFYSITLLLGVWCTVFLMQMLRLTVLLDRWLAGKGPPPVLVSADGTEAPGKGAAEYARQLHARVLSGRS